MRTDLNQQLIPYLPAILTIVAIVLGSVFNNRRIDHLDTRIGDLKELFKAEIGRLEGTMNARFDRIEDRLDRLENRVSRLEDQRIVR
jgi:hypothetical protein